MKSFLLLIITFAFFLACKKGIEHDKQYIRGRVFLTDTITTNKREIPVAGKKVWLSKLGDTLNFLYSTKTDTEGYFTFDLLADNDDRFTLISYDTVGNHYYQGRVDANRGEKDVSLMLSLSQSAQNGLILYTRDPSNGILPSVSVRIYNNINLALINDSAAAYARITTDATGKGYVFNLPAGSYFINAEKGIDTISYQRMIKIINVSNTGFSVDTMMLMKKPAQNGFVLFMKDSLQGSIPFTNVRLYNSFLLSLQDDSTAAVASFVSDANGKITKTNLAAATYYVNARKVSGADTYSRFGKVVTMPASGFVNDTLVLQRSFPVYQNGLMIETRDSLNNRMPATSLYLFTSSVLAMAHISNGAIRTVITDDYGNAALYNLPAGNYFLNAQKIINDSTVFERLVKPISIPLSGLFSDTLMLYRKRR